MATSTRKAQYRPSPIGIARHSWVNKPDVKYNQDGVYHVSLVMEGADVEGFRKEIDADCERAYAEEVTDNPEIKGAEKKKWTVYHPYEEETDDDGNPTGRLVFKFKQNAKIRLHDGSVKVFKMGIRDSKNKATNANVFGGATIRTMYAPRNVAVKSTKQAGVRLDFCLVQLIKEAERTGGGFDEVEGGYVDDALDREDSNEQGNASNEDRTSADY
jgi:hypothetical protein